MSEPFIGEIKMFAGNFAPRNWALCDGQLLAVSQNDALFSLLGTIYGGDGRTTFGLPEMRGRLPVHMGSGPGLPSYNIGARSGQERVALTSQTVATHNHTYGAASGAGAASSPIDSFPAGSGSTAVYQDSAANLDSMNSTSLSNTGGSQPHNNMMPFLCVNFIIALFGVYPSRN